MCEFEFCLFAVGMLLCNICSISILQQLDNDVKRLRISTHPESAHNFSSLIFDLVTFEYDSLLTVLG